MTFRFGEGKSGDPMPFKKFESSDEIEDRKRKRQEEWEKVRRPDQPESKYMFVEDKVVKKCFVVNGTVL